MRGKRLFNAACASCHVGGGTRTNQNHGFIGAARVCMHRNEIQSVWMLLRNVGLAIEELSGAQPNRASVEG